MLPFKLIPAYKDYIWGGTRLKTEYGKSTDLDILAESWELSAHPDGSSVIATGELAGTRFDDFVSRFPRLCGTAGAGHDRFPILIKFIDSNAALSIQVHPGDDYGWRTEGEPGKTEMWVVLDCRPDAFLYFGLQHPLEREEFARRIADGTLTDVLQQVPVHPGDVFFIAAGTIHAIGAGITLAEIQENSNTTYRVFDFGRLGADGKPRPLHIEKALDVTSLGPAGADIPGAQPPAAVPGGTLQQLAACPWFSVARLALDGRYTHRLDSTSFVSVLCTGGEGTLEAEATRLPVAKGDSLFVPADNTGFTLAGHGEFLLTWMDS